MDLYAPTTKARTNALHVFYRHDADALTAMPWLVALLADESPGWISPDCGHVHQDTIGDEALCVIEDTATLPSEERLANAGDPKALLAAKGRVRTAAIRELVAMLQDRTHSVNARSRAAIALGILADAQSAKVLTAILSSDPAPAIRQSAMYLMWKLPRDLVANALTAALQDTDPWVRHDASSSLGRLEAAQAVTGLMAILEDPVIEVRTRAAWALGHIGDRRAVTPLTGLLASEEGKDRSYAVWALGLIGDASAATSVAPLVRDPDTNLRRAAVEALGRMKASEHVPLIMSVLEDDNVLVRKAACEALGRTGDKRAVGPLLERLAEPNRQVVAAAAEALGALGDATAVPGLIQALDYQGDGWGHLARAQAALALGKISDRRAVLPLIGVLREEGERREAKGAAAAALGQIGDPRALEPLCLAARAARSESVMKALNHFNDPCALSTLGDLSRNENWHVRLAAVRALGENPRPESLPPLRAATKDKEGYVRATAQKLLEKRVKGNRGLALPLISVLSVLTIAVTWLFIRKRRSTTSGTDGPKNAPAESG